jgi:predicted AAA+ superfamily ATPase
MIAMIDRYQFPELKYSLDKFPVVCIAGPRQCGKTTLARQYCAQFDHEYVFLDLEKVEDQRRISDPGLFFRDNRHKLVVIDEIQHQPELLPEIRAEVDTDRRPGRFLILGSAGPDIISGSSETLAGRIKYLYLQPFIMNELGDEPPLNDLYFWGGFPEVVLDKDIRFRKDWLNNFITTYLMCDLPMLGLKASPVQVRRLWEMLAYQAGSLLNSSTLARALGISNHTVNAYMDYLENAFMISRVMPFDSNLGKRIVKAKKVYLSDTGLLHRLLWLDSYDQLMGSPMAGHTWENFVFTQILPLLKDRWTCWFYRTHTGIEADLVLGKGLAPEISLEVKLSSAPQITKSFAQAIDDLKTSRNYIVIPIGDTYRLREDITVCSLKDFINRELV